MLTTVVPINDAILALGGLGGALLTIFGVFKYIIPAIKSGIGVSANSKRIKKLEDDQKELVDTIDEMRKESRIADRLLVRAMVEIVDNRLTGNNVDGLKSTKKDLMSFLQEN